jgi:hypothetical protein
LARFPQEEAPKGSQKWIQRLVNEKSVLLNSLITQNLDLSESTNIHWLSPLKSDDYSEYRDKAFLERLSINTDRVNLSGFWPKGGPQWDALGRSSYGKIFLVEAKSYIPELISNLKATNQGSSELIQKSLAETKARFGSKTDLDWTKTFYQYASRLAHLYLLRKSRLQAYLIDVYFISDLEVEGPMTIDEWKGAIRLMNRCLGLREPLLKNLIANLFIDVRALN